MTGGYQQHHVQMICGTVRVSMILIDLSKKINRTGFTLIHISLRSPGPIQKQVSKKRFF